MQTVKTYRRPAFAMTIQLIEKASELWGVEGWRINRREKTWSISHPRFAVIWALRQVGLTLWAIANHMHLKDHSCVRYAIRQAERMRLEDPLFKQRSDQLADLARFLRGQQVIINQAA